jgi:hypothetical protein
LRKSSLLLWALLALFVLRVAGQALVALFDVRFLPPMEAWYSGVMPYPYLLPAQIVIIVLMASRSAFSPPLGFSSGISI